MKPKATDHSQGLLFQSRLSKQLNPKHELYVLSQQIDWKRLEDEFSTCFVEGCGATAKPVRLVVCMFMLQHMFGYSDEDTVKEWIENPYWQFFCGFDYLQWSKPIDPSSMSRWRKRLGPNGAEKIFQATIQAAIGHAATGQGPLAALMPSSTLSARQAPIAMGPTAVFLSRAS